MNNELIGGRIQARRKELGYTLDDVAKEIGVAKSTIQRYEKGTIEKIKLPVIEAIARSLDVDPAWICGKTEKMGKAIVFKNTFSSNLLPLEPMDKVPLVGRIACGAPILAEQNIEDYIDLPHHIQADFALICEGDSMINAGIQEGDMVYIKQQEEVENGEIAAVMVGDDEATLKRFYRKDNVVHLIAENPRFQPLVFIGEEMNKVRVIGRAVAYTRIIK